MLIRPQPAKAAPDQPIHAKFSIPYTVAAALLDGEVTLATFLPARIADTSTRALASKVVEVRNPAWTRAEAASGSLTFVMRDGGRIVHRVMQAAGHPDRPISDSALIAKFADCAAYAATPVGAAEAEALAGRILAFPPQSSASSLLGSS
jgi:2-methylcitrate dehydratase PrpD